MNDNQVDLIVNWVVNGKDDIKQVQKDLDSLGGSKDSKGKKSEKTFKDLAEQVITNHAHLGEFGKMCVSAASKLGVMTIAATATVGVINRVVEAARENSSVYSESSSALSDLTYHVNAYSSSLMDYETLIEEINRVFDTNSHPISKIVTMMESALSATRDLSVAEELVSLALSEQTRSGRDAEDCLKDIIAAYIKTGEVADDAGNILTDFDSRMAKIRENLTAVDNEQLGYIKDADDRFKAITEKWKDWIGEFGAYVGAFFKNIASDVLGLTWGIGELLSDLFTGDFDKLGNDVKSLGSFFGGAEGAVTAGGIGAGIGGVIGAIAGGPAGAIIGADIGGLITGTIASIFGDRADGGIVSVPGIDNVGEQGPERVYLPKDSYVSPSDHSGGIVIDLTVEGSVWTTEQLTDEILSVINDRVRLRGAW